MADDLWPPGFCDRQDSGDDAGFYAPPRLVTHLDGDVGDSTRREIADA